MKKGFRIPELHHTLKVALISVGIAFVPIASDLAEKMEARAGEIMIEIKQPDGYDEDFSSEQIYELALIYQTGVTTTTTMMQPPYQYKSKRKVL